MNKDTGQNMARSSTNDMHLESRVGHLEGTMETLAQEVRVTSESVREVTHTLSKVKDEIFARLGSLTAPRWPLIISIGTLLITILGLAGTIVALMLSGQRDAIETLKSQYVSLQTESSTGKLEDGRNMEWRNNVTKVLVDLDVKLQKEANLLIDKTESKITALDTKLQLEFNNTNRILDGELKEIREQIVDLRKWRLGHNEEDSFRHGQLSTLADMLKDKLTIIEARQYDINSLVHQLDVLRLQMPIQNSTSLPIIKPKAKEFD